MNVPRVLAVVAIGAFSLAGCSSTSASSPSAVSPASGSIGTAVSGNAVSGTVKVAAAASLKKSFDQLAATFEQQNPGAKVVISYDGSAVLATQIIGGAPVDVFASADDKNMAKVTAAKLITTKPAEFASNTLQIAVPRDNPKKITSLKDLTAPGLKVVLCGAAQPCGAAAQTALKAAGVAVTPVSQEQNVTAVLTKVESGDADAGLVYRTDVFGSAGKVTGVAFAQSARAVNQYPIAALDAAPDPAAAKAFIALVTGPTGEKVLAAAGFGPPA